jgi:hypothetical protein
MTETHEVDSGWSTGVSAPVGYNRDYFAAVGERSDAAAASPSGLHSVPALLKGLLFGLGLGSGSDPTDTTPRLISNEIAAVGAPTDSPAEFTENASIPSLLKGMLRAAGI